MISFFVKHPATTIIFVLFFVVLGFISYFNLNIETSPRIDFPLVSVKVLYPGASPIEVESQVTKKLEDIVVEISGVKKITSRSYESFSFIMVEFLLEEDVNIKSIEIKDKIEAILNELPSNIEKPIIEKFDPFIEPVIDLVLSSDSLNSLALFEFADKKLKNEFSAISGVSSIELFGGKERQINIFLDPELMKKHYVTITDVLGTIAQRNLNIPSGLIEKTNSSINVRFVGEFASLKELSEMPLITQDASNIMLQDVAKIEDGFKKIEKLARFNGQDAVILSIKKASDANAVKIAQAINDKLPQIRKNLPEEMKLTLANDTTKFIVAETFDTLKNIFLGILLTVLILYVFTGNLRVTFISSLVIPSSIISSLLLVDFSGFTINMMTLLAIATALGTLIANAIVIIESILAELETGKDKVLAAIDGTKKVTTAVLASAGTNLVVFTPIGFMGGITGQFMKQFGLTVVYATLFSILASFSLTPMLSALLLKSTPKKFNKYQIMSKVANRSIHFLISEYRLIFNLMFRFPKSTIIVSIFIFWTCLQTLPFVGNEFLPVSDQNLITIKVTAPQDSTIDKTLEIVHKIENEIHKIPEVHSFLSSIGENGPENATIKVLLPSVLKRNKSDVEIINELIPGVSIIPDTEISLMRGKGAGAGAEGDITINIYGNDYDQMILQSNKIINDMTESGFFRSIVSSYKKPKNEIQFIPNTSLLNRVGTNNSVLATTLRSSLYGNDNNVYKEDGEEYKINVQLDEAYRQSLDDLSKINISTKQGLIPITELGESKTSIAIPTIWHRDRQRIIQIDALLSKSTSGQVRKSLEAQFEKMPWPKNTFYKFAGTAEFQEESTFEILKAFIIAIILTYMILTAILNSFIHPLTIASTIVMSFSGVFVCLLLTDSTINIASMLGMVMIVGLVVNNAILMIDQTIQKQNEGQNLMDAIWFGISEKFRAILMTSTAIIFGALPQLGSTMIAKSSMGAVIIGGMIGSLVFTFILIPVIYWYLERFRRLLRR